MLRTRLRPAPGPGACLISAGDVFGLTIAILILGYLVYALFRGENL